MGDHGGEPGRLDVLGQRLRQHERAAERKLHEDGRQVTEPVAAHVFVQKARHRGELPPEAEVEAECGCPRSHLGVRLAGCPLARGVEWQRGPDMRRPEEDPRSPQRSSPAEREAVLDRRGSVVAGGDDVRVNVDEGQASSLVFPAAVGRVRGRARPPRQAAARWPPYRRRRAPSRERGEASSRGRALYSARR